MKGYFRKRNCTCKKKRCTCGAKWSFTIDVGINPQTGKRKQKTRSGFRTKEEAEIVASRLYNEIVNGTHIDENNILYEQFVKEWLEMYRKTGVKVSTMQVRSFESNHLISHFKHVKLKDITKRMYQNCLNDLSDELAYKSVVGIHACGKMIFNKAVELDMLSSSPAEFAKIPRERVTVEQLEERTDIPKYMEKDELALFLKHAQEDGFANDYIIFKMLAFTGMRIGELAALKWTDIDFDQSAISITKTLYMPSKTREYQLLTPKTIASKRVIEVDELLLEDLRKHKKEQAISRMQNAKNWHNEGFVISKTYGQNMGYPEYKNIWRRMARLLDISGLNKSLSPHSMRHTHTTLLAEAGVDLTEIMERLGHKDDNITRNIYLHVTKEKRKEAVQKFSKLMMDIT